MKTAKRILEEFANVAYRINSEPEIIEKTLQELTTLFPKRTNHGFPLNSHCDCSECVRNRVIDELHKKFKG